MRQLTPTELSLNDGCFVWNEFHEDVDSMAEHCIQDLTSEDMTLEECLKVLPDKAYAAEREYLSAPSLEDLIHDIAHPRYGYYADTVWADAVEDLWFLVETDFHWDSEGLDDLQSAIDVFTARNQTTYRLLGRFKWFDPVRWSYGKKALQAALNQFEVANRHFWVYNESTYAVALDADFWIPWLMPYLQAEQG